MFNKIQFVPVTLNIGLKVSANYFDATGEAYATTRNDVLEMRSIIVGLCGMRNWRGEVKVSATERTLVIHGEMPTELYLNNLYLNNYLFHFIADTWQQECIAVYDHDDDFGELVGTYSYLWGEFDKEHFIFLEGTV